MLRSDGAHSAHNVHDALLQACDANETQPPQVAPFSFPQGRNWSQHLRGWSAASNWRWRRTLEYSIRVGFAGALTTFLVLWTPACNALHPASDTVKFLMPVFAILAAGPTLGESIRDTIGCTISSVFYAIICWVEIQGMNLVGLGGSAASYIIMLFVTCFVMVASPFSVPASLTLTACTTPNPYRSPNHTQQYRPNCNHNPYLPEH